MADVRQRLVDDWAADGWAVVEAVDQLGPVHEYRVTLRFIGEGEPSPLETMERRCP